MYLLPTRKLKQTADSSSQKMDEKRGVTTNSSDLMMMTARMKKRSRRGLDVHVVLVAVVMLLISCCCIHGHPHQQHPENSRERQDDYDDDATTRRRQERAIHHNNNKKYRPYHYGWTRRRRQRHYNNGQQQHYVNNNNNNWNLTCHFINQPLNHFDLPRNQSGTFRQRYCVNTEFVQYHTSIPKKVITRNHDDDDDDDDNNDDHEQQQQQQQEDEMIIILDPKTPIFLYTGNESPLEEYINNTGLLWELAQAMHAQIVFVEHRYEGKSLPSSDMPNCLAYASSIQALADYANLIETILWKKDEGTTTTNATSDCHRRPVIAFGGSYGGMLSAWMRMKYPNMIAGAIAGSAPIHALPFSHRPIDGAWQIITQGLQRPYPPNHNRTTTTTTTTTTSTSASSTDNDNNHSNSKSSSSSSSHCASNLLASWPLMEVLGREETGRELLTQAFSLCHPIRSSDDVALLRHWASTPWFDMAEGSFPYPSNYIPFALTHRQDVQLPAWPLQAACWKASNLHANDFGVAFHGNLSNVRYNVTYGNNNVGGGSDDDDGIKSTALLKLAVDWDTVTAIMPCGDNGTTTTTTSASSSLSCLEKVLRSNSKLRNNIMDLLVNVRKAVSVWYNMTQDVVCYNLTAAPNRAAFDKDVNNVARDERQLLEMVAKGNDVGISKGNEHFYLNENNSPKARCQHRMEMGSWPALCCNEDINLIMTLGAGLGNDAMWPPSHPRGVTSYADIVALENWTMVDPECRDDDGIFGFPQGPIDPWSTFYDIVYGTVPSSIKAHSNIIFSNGLLDPWSAGGVYDNGKWSWNPNHKPPYYKGIPGLYVQNLSSWSSSDDDRMLIAVLMEYGGHHTDLMFRNATHDPPDVTAAREIEREYIQKWIDQFWNN